MKITYTAPNRSHHYPYAAAMHSAGHLHAFIAGFSRFSPRSALPVIGNKLKRHDFFQNLYLASLKFHLGSFATSTFNDLTNLRLDKASYRSAKESDVFIYYRTEGFTTTNRLKKENAKTICVMEEVNSHVDVQAQILNEEWNQLGMKPFTEKIPDHKQRLKAYENSDYILCPSEFVRRSFISKGFAADKLLKVNFGFSNTIVNEAIKTGRSTDTFRVLYVGQLHYRKGLRYAVEAFRKLRHPRKEFIIVGGKAGVTGLEKLQLPKEIVFTGVLKGEELNDQYRRANLFVLPSLEEGLALVQLEALSFGLPILITTNTGGDDIIRDGIQGFIVPPADTDALAGKMQQLADDPQLLAAMSVEALNAAKAYGSWDLAVERLIGQLKPIVERNELLSV